VSSRPAVRTRATNVLVIGAGGGGLRAAVAAHDAGVEVLVLSHRQRHDAHTSLAAGGINAALGTVDPEDSWQQHAHDTFVEGAELSEPRAVELLARESPQAIEELADWGCDFTRTDDGRIDQRFFGAHTYRRTCYAGDWTGRAVLRTVADQAAARRIEVSHGQCVSHLLVSNGRCFGALAFDLDDGTRTVIVADTTILATGGHTRLWLNSSSRRDENTGDGMALALAAGCRLSNLELVQFHPTGMVHPEEWAGTLVTEAVRGTGGRLFNAEGERFMERYDPDRMELSARDEVAAACAREIAEGRGTERGAVLLDVSHLDRDTIVDQLPRIRRQLVEAQLLDIVDEPIEVAPTAHYSMGGIVVDPETLATDVDRLFAVGECTSGVHGANRLGGNSLAEVVVFGRRAGEAAAEASLRSEGGERDHTAIDAAVDELEEWSQPGEELALPVLHELRRAMWDGCGVVRDEAGIASTIDRVRGLQDRVRAVDGSGTSIGWVSLARSVALRRAMTVAEATALAAAERRESRGAHRRSDHPDPGEERFAIDVTLDADGALTLSTREMPPIPDLGPDLEGGGSLADAQRLLE
jgi:succinate dehydrogenase / fumarate reductase, flavoprotein subunit